MGIQTTLTFPTPYLGRIIKSRLPIHENTVRWVVYQWLRSRLGEEIDGKTLEEIHPAHPKSGDRIMRDLRSEGWLYVPCIARAKSLYYVSWIRRLDNEEHIDRAITAEQYIKQMESINKIHYKLES